MSNVLFICTGNICRSAYAEAVTNSAGINPLITIRSAGTHALPGISSPHELNTAAASSGISCAHHRSRPATGQLLQETDLILTMTPDHRAWCVSAAPTTLQRTFTVCEFAFLLDRVGPPAATSVRELAYWAGRNRYQIPATVQEQSIIDPYRRSMTVYHQMVSQLDPLLDTINHALALCVPSQEAQTPTPQYSAHGFGTLNLSG